MSKTTEKVRQTLQRFHVGDSITGSDLALTIKQLTIILEMFQDLNIKSMPEFDVFEKALRKELHQLEEFQSARLK